MPSPIPVDHLSLEQAGQGSRGKHPNKAEEMVAAAFLRNLIAAVPYKLHIVLTDNGIQFTNHERHSYAFEHIFDRVCREHQIDHRLNKIKHPWTNGQVERVNCTIKEATVKRLHYDDHDQLRNHLANFISDYNFGRRLKTVKGLTLASSSASN